VINSVESAWVITTATDSLLALLAGALLGAFYFFGLWWTIRRLGSSQYVALLFMFSMLFRSLVVIAGFYFILGDHWQQLVPGLLGFMLLRMLVTRIARVEKPSSLSKQKDGYAP